VLGIRAIGIDLGGYLFAVETGRRRGCGTENENEHENEIRLHRAEP